MCEACSCSLPPYLQVVPLLVIIAFTLWLYTSFTLVAQPKLRHLHTSPYALLLFHTTVLMLFWSLYQCLRSRDSFLPKKSKATTEENASIELKWDGSRRYCRKCRAYKPDRTHHCSTCDRCLLKMDHHCVYLNKCIGFYNYKFFLQFLSWSAIACLYLGYLVYPLLGNEIQHMVTLYSMGRLHLTSSPTQIVLFFFCSVSVGFALLVFFLMHLYFTIQNTTTLEYMEKRREPGYINYYHVGILQNFQQVFGAYSEIMYWFLPLQPPSVVKRRGRTFDLNDLATKDE